MDEVNVVLVGDSIRLHAEPFVRRSLPSRFKLRSPTVNGKSSDCVAAGIRDWIPPGTVDIVHLNCGLHDIRRDPGQRRPRISPTEYIANLRQVFEYLAATGACVIWATSTPVREALDEPIDSPRWHQADLVQYNRLSVELALGFGFRVNDLHGRLSEAPVDALLMPDGVHFNHAGNALIGRQVAAAIRACRP